MTNETPTPDSDSNGFVLSDKLYKQLKFLVQVVLPAFSTLYFTLGAIWGLPNVEQIIGTITAFTLFFGILLGISNRTYNNSTEKYGGYIDVGPYVNGTKTYSLVINKEDPEDVDEMDEILFKVRKT